MSKNIFKLFIFIVNLPLYWLSYLVPKKNNLWIFGAWAGKKYADNSKYFFEYVVRNKPEIDAVWITKNKDVYNLLISKKCRVVYAYSIQGYYYTMRAKVAIISNTKLGDMNGFVINNNTFLVQLWHGSPMKKMGFDIKNNKYTNTKKFTKVFPYIVSNYNLYLVASKTVANNLKSAFKIKNEVFFISGYPRCDVFMEEKSSKLISDSIYKIVYMPTYRETLGEELNIVNTLNLEQFNGFLNKFKIDFFVKLHPQSKLKEYFTNKNFTNIKYLEIDDIYTVLNQFDLLVTDYSSIYFDFLLLEKPIILAPFDLDNYLADKGMYIDYNNINEFKVKTWNELEYIIYKLIVKKEDKYIEDRKKLAIKYNKNINGEFSTNLYDKIMGDILL